MREWRSEEEEHYGLCRACAVERKKATVETSQDRPQRGRQDKTAAAEIEKEENKRVWPAFISARTVRRVR